MLITTTGSLEGFEILEYKGPVFAEVVAGINMFKDFAAGMRNIFGGRSAAYEGELQKARDEAIQQALATAASWGANAVIGVKFDYESAGNGGMMMVIFSGTAVVVRKK